MRPDAQIVFPVHANPAVQRIVHDSLGGEPRIDLIQPVDYFTFIKLMEASWLVLTDSGGVQEEAPVLGKPVLVLRETTERPEAVECGVARAVGTDPDAIVRHTLALLDNPAERAQMARAVSPFGDGQAAQGDRELLADLVPVGDPGTAGVVGVDGQARALGVGRRDPAAPQHRRDRAHR